MRDPNRLDDFYKEVTQIHKKYFPDWRVGQFWMNFFGYVHERGRDPFFPEEDEMLEWLRKFVGKVG